MSELEDGDVVQVVMMKGLADTINNMIAVFGWELVRSPWLDSDDPDSLPVFSAVLNERGAARLREEKKGDQDPT